MNFIKNKEIIYLQNIKTKLSPQPTHYGEDCTDGFWSVLKRCFRRKGTNYKGSIEEYFGEIIGKRTEIHDFHLLCIFRCIF